MVGLSLIKLDKNSLYYALICLYKAVGAWQSLGKLGAEQTLGPDYTHYCVGHAVIVHWADDSTGLL